MIAQHSICKSGLRMRLFGLKAVFQSLTTKLKIWSPLHEHRDVHVVMLNPLSSQ